jgi:hypothetical protein
VLSVSEDPPVLVNELRRRATRDSRVGDGAIRWIGFMRRLAQRLRSR